MQNIACTARVFTGDLPDKRRRLFDFWCIGIYLDQTHKTKNSFGLTYDFNYSDIHYWCRDKLLNVWDESSVQKQIMGWWFLRTKGCIFCWIYSNCTNHPCIRLKLYFTFMISCITEFLKVQARLPKKKNPLIPVCFVFPQMKILFTIKFRTLKFLFVPLFFIFGLCQMSKAHDSWTLNNENCSIFSETIFSKPSDLN